MKKLGLVGGMGPESTISYYRGIVYGARERVGDGYFPTLIMESVNVFDVLRLCGEQNYEELTEYLLRAVRHLVRGGADFAAIAANTPHIVFERLKERSPIPLVGIVESACQEAERRNLKKLGLLGTGSTATEVFFRQAFLRRGMEIIVPPQEERDYVHQKISSELEHGVVKSETLGAFQTIISNLRSEARIDAVILGCTELPLLLNEDVSPVPCLDAMEIHIRAIIEEMLR